MGDSSDITRLLDAARAGEDGVSGDLYRAVYEELRTIARAQRRRWRGDQTLNTTALIHEAYLKLSGSDSAQWENRGHFFATAARAMRQILVNYAQMRHAAKRGGNAIQVPLDESLIASESTAEQLLEIHSALEKLERSHPRQCRVVECRIFAGMTLTEIADAMSLSLATVKRDWVVASGALFEDIGAPGDEPKS